MSMEIFVEDWHDLHKGFLLELEPGFTALVGPNGAGKTTMLQQIKEHARKEGVEVWEYSNVRDGGQTARSQYQFTGDIENLAASLTASEGENVALNFSNKAGELGTRVRMAATERKPLIVLLDAIDSGACQRQSEIVRKRRRNFVVFRRGGNKIKRFLAGKEY